MFCFILLVYFIVLLIGIAIVNRWKAERRNNHRYFDQEAYECHIVIVVFWPISIPIVILASIMYGIYKGFYYVVDKIYTKVVSCLRRREEETN